MLEFNELSKGQKIFKKVVDSFAKKYDMQDSLLYWFHNSETVSIDGDLHSILNGFCEYNFSLPEKIKTVLFNAGYFLESINGCDYGIYKI